MTKIDREFKLFDQLNPDVFRAFVRFARDAMVMGHRTYSADAILHRVRWEMSLRRNGKQFKINNNFSSRYARKFQKLFPRHAGFFRTRELRQAERMAA